MSVRTRTYRPTGLVVREHELEVPLDHADPASEPLTVFAREVADPDGLNRPLLVFFQGGPGFEATRPASPRSPGWMGRALAEFRVLLLDQRGTGRSSPIGRLPGRSPEGQAAYLRHHRADAIVADAEALRVALGSEPWTVLGQSFGGFCVLRYLSAAPEGLRAALLTGGLPPVGRPVDDIYAATYARTLVRNERFYARYPDDRERFRALLELVEREDVRLASGDRLSARRLRMLGNLLGMSGGAETLHYVLELPPGSPAFAHDVEQSTMAFARNPLYAVIHEAAYADGGATAWSAHRLCPSVEEHPELLTAEHVFPWLFDELAALRPLKAAAELLAAETWPALYDAGRLAANRVPAAAAIYTDDLYVERRFSEETADLVAGLRPWITSEYDHNGLRVDGERILDRLLALVRDRA